MKTLFLILIHSALAHHSPSLSDLEHLQGLWLQQCDQKVIRSEMFQQSQVTLTESSYADDRCNTNLIRVINEGRFILPAPGQIDFQFTSVRVQLNNEAFVKDFNSRAVCGFQDWKLAEEKEISGRLCEIIYVGSPHRIPAAGDMRYGIYRLNDDRLYFGRLTREQNAMSPEKRPTNYDPRFYTKAPQAL